MVIASLPLTMENEKQCISEFVARFGCSASVALFDPACQLFRSRSVEGAIGYRVAYGTAVVFGDPLCMGKDIPVVVEEFHAFCKAKGLRVLYTTVSKDFAKWAVQGVCRAMIEVGEEFIVVPQVDPTVGAAGRKLRNKLSHCRQAGVEIGEYVGVDGALEQKMEQVSAAWLQGRKGPQVFLAGVRLFQERHGKRWLYAMREGKVIGVMLLNRLEAREGWVLNLLMTTPEAPHGTSELLVIALLEKLRAEGCAYLSLGAVTPKNLGEIVGMGALSSWVARRGFTVARKIFKLDGKQVYWKKYQPRSEGLFLVFSDPRLRFSEVAAIMQACNMSLL